MGDKRLEIQPLLQNIEKRSLNESNHANVIKSTTGCKVDKLPLGEGLNAEGHVEVGAADSLTQVDRLIVTPI